MSTWRDDARCLDTDPEMWFEATPGQRASNRDREDHAASVLLMRAICAACPRLPAATTNGWTARVTHASCWAAR